MSKLALINVGLHGHVNPTLGFTEELVRRGHQVTYFGEEAFKERIGATGARFRGYGSRFGALVAERAKAQLQGLDPWTAQPGIRERFLSELERSFPTLLAALEELDPDVVIYDFVSLAGRLAASKLALPAVQFFTSYAANAQFDLMARAFKSRWQAAAEDRAIFATRLADLELRFGLPPLDPETFLGHVEADNLVFLPRSFQPEGPTFDDRFHFVGPCLSRPRLAEAAPLPSGGEPLLLIALGTIFNAQPSFYAECLNAFATRRWRIVMAVGPYVDPKSLGPLPPHVVVEPFVPQLAVLRQTQLFVSHGGMNSTMEALALGVPLVAVPQMPEQELTAERVEELGLGARLSRTNATAAALADAVERVHASPKIRASVHAMQCEIDAAGGSAAAAAVIERAARRPPTPPRRPSAWSESPPAP